MFFSYRVDEVQMYGVCSQTIRSKSIFLYQHIARVIVENEYGTI